MGKYGSPNSAANMWNVIGGNSAYALNGSDAWAFSSRHDGGVHFLLCDWAVRLLSENISASVINNLAQRADNNTVGEF